MSEASVKSQLSFLIKILDFNCFNLPNILKVVQEITVTFLVNLKANFSSCSALILIEMSFKSFILFTKFTNDKPLENILF